MTDRKEPIPPETSDEAFIAGDSVVIRVTVKNEDGSVKDLFQADASFAMAEFPGADPVVSKTTAENDMEIADEVNGEIEISLVPSDTKTLVASESKSYYYEVEVKDNNGDISTVSTGQITIQADTAALP